MVADAARKATEKKLRKMERHIKGIYNQATDEITDKAYEFFKQFEERDKRKRLQLKNGKIDKKEYLRWRRTQMFIGSDWQNRREQLCKMYLETNVIAQDYINEQLPEIYAVNFNYIKPFKDSMPGYSFDLVDAQTVKNLATKDKTLLPYKEINGVKNVRWNTKKVNSAVLQGILQGDDMYDIAKRLENVTEMNKNSAIRNARTSVTSAENSGRYDRAEQLAADGAIIEKEWLSVADSRTRDTHSALNHKKVKIDEAFDNGLLYPGDVDGEPAEVYNCRCTAAYKVTGFKKVEKK